MHKHPNGWMERPNSGRVEYTVRWEERVAEPSSLGTLAPRAGCLENAVDTGIQAVQFAFSFLVGRRRSKIGLCKSGEINHKSMVAAAADESRSLDALKEDEERGNLLLLRLGGTLFLVAACVVLLRKGCEER